MGLKRNSLLPKAFFPGSLMEPVKVRIRNAEYLVQGEENEQQVQRIADYVNDKLKEIEQGTEGLSEKRTAILAALDIAGDYFQILKEKENLVSTVRQKTQSLIRSIDSVLGPSSKR
jgi:cell division protein ZapA